MDIMFIKAALETDAVFDPVRTTNFLGMWYMASLLKKKGYGVRYLDEVVRNGGLNKKIVFKRTVEGNGIADELIGYLSHEEFEKIKMSDFKKLTPKEFVKQYSAFREEGKIVRTMVRTGNFIHETLAEIEKNIPNFVGIPLIASANYCQAVKLGKAIKDYFPTIKIIYGGQHISSEYKNFIKENPWVDHVVVNDGMSVIEDVIIGKRKERIIDGGSCDMKNFPLLDPAILKENNYPIEPTHAFSSSGRKNIDFMFSRGCFRCCEFCVSGSNKHKINSLREGLADYQLSLFKKQGYQELIIQDDAFVHPEPGLKHFKGVLGLMKKHGFYWQSNGGFDFQTLTKDVTDLLINYNKEGEGKITSLYVPFNPREWNKNSSAAKTMITRYHDNCENLKRLREEAGIYVFTSEIIGTPEQTTKLLDSDIELHKEMIKQGYVDASLTFSATLLPGTTWHKNNKGMIINEKDYAGYSIFITHHKTVNIPDPKIIEEYIVRRAKELNCVQRAYKWGTAFPNY